MKEILKTRDGSTLYEVCLQDNNDRVMIVFPGGAYVSLADNEGECVAKRFAELGYSSYVMKYCVTGDGTQRINELMEDVHEAVIEIKKRHENALTALCGFSAGGNLIANYGNKYHDVDALLLCYAVTDWGDTIEVLETDMGMESINARLRKLRDDSALSLFGTLDITDEMNKSVSPILTVSEKTPASFIWHSREDHLVHSYQSVRYYSLLQKKGVRSELHIYNEGEHGAGLGSGTSLETWPLAADDFIKQIEKK